MRFLFPLLSIRQEDGSLPGDPLPLLEGLIWFLFAPLGIFALIWILVAAADRGDKKKASGKQDLLTSIE
jgi:hypothetical protein